jgi:hypothetical protein
MDAAFWVKLSCRYFEKDAKLGCPDAGRILRRSPIRSHCVEGPQVEMGESSRAARLTYRGFETGRRIGELEITLRIVQHEEALCPELGNKDGLQRIYGNQALILQAWWCRPEEAFELLKKQEAFKRSAWSLGNKDRLQIDCLNDAPVRSCASRRFEVRGRERARICGL